MAKYLVVALDVNTAMELLSRGIHPIGLDDIGGDDYTQLSAAMDAQTRVCADHIDTFIARVIIHRDHNGREGRYMATILELQTEATLSYPAPRTA